MNKLSDEQIAIIARVLADRSAEACNVNKDDNWAIYYQDFIDDAHAIAAALAPSTAAQSGDYVMVPKWEGEFKTFNQWVNKGQSWLKSPSYRPAVCIDAKGRRCAIGSDMMRARDEGAFPVRYFWEFELSAAPAVSQPQAQSGELTSNWIRDIQKRLIEVGADQDDDVCSLMCEAAVLLAALSAAQSEQEKP